MFTLIKDIIYSRYKPVSYARRLGVRVGEDVRLISIRRGSGTFGSEPYLISIGNHVTIAAEVQFITHDGGVWIFRSEEPNIDVFGPITISDNVFIGYRSIIMPGVKIGQNSVIGAGAIVTRDIPSNVVAVGCPAKVIMTTIEYRKSIEKKAEYIRNLNENDKRSYLLSKYGLVK